MSTRAPSSPQDSPARARIVVGFYGAVGLVGFFWHATAQDSNDVWRLDPSQGLATLAWTPMVGVGVGLAVVQVFRALEHHFAWLPALHAEFRSIFGRPGTGELILLAATSALAEELLFRGAMLDAWGLVPSSLVFALLHIPPRWQLWPWTASSLVAGLLFAELTLLTGNLGAATAAHFVVNLQNLWYITRHPPRPTVRGPVRPQKLQPPA
ncbi:MAG: CPBP family intramembrane metalloprotease [Deltaproteobacteria bacterium]|nr:CPBP family intramembrane metalloprotease [Deltaproteobacteria bacterium]MBK8716863.1 CPBP family intramembrane metalloprotease [Deltaproteobacteria bacterium]MBP7286969.1 CPBP family intramembrane metalloprotease [Nannocystaceae bacterium]